MKIIDRSEQGEGAAAAAGTVFSGGTLPFRCERIIAREHFMEVSINGAAAMRIVCTNDRLPELIIGQLLSEGMAETPEDIRQIYICERGETAQVVLNSVPGAADSAYVEKIGTCCTGNRLLTGAFLRGAPLPRLERARWRPEWVTGAFREMQAAVPLFERTHAVHSCGLIHRGELRFCCEDIGRHNAVDKVIGCAVREGLEPGECILLSSGRIAADMAEKAARAGIPVFATTKSVTDAALRLASECGMTLAAYVREDSLTILEPVPPEEVSE